MKFLEKLDIFKPLGKGLAEADTFMRREMPFNMSWGFPAAVLGASYFAPQLMGAMGTSGGATTGNGMLQSLGLPANAGQMSSPAFQTSFSPEYLNQLAAAQGVDAGDPTFFQNLVGNNEQGLYNQFNAPVSPQGGGMNMLSQALRGFGGSGNANLVDLPDMSLPRQQPFVFLPEPKDIQEKDMDIKKLAKVLRKNYGKQA